MASFPPTPCCWSRTWEVEAGGARSAHLAYARKTTLSVDDTIEIVRRFAAVRPSRPKVETSATLPPTAGAR